LSRAQRSMQGSARIAKAIIYFPVQSALSDQKETASFFEYNITGYNSFEKCTVDRVNTASELRVDTTKIDDLCTTNGIETIDILKLDIQMRK
jgi:FkbM family methyltransferase